MDESKQLVPVDKILNRVYILRNQRVMLDSDLAGLYGVETKQLNLQVKRNKKRFPEDFMFQVTGEEYTDLRLHNETSRNWGGRRYLPYAFTEQGIAMLSSILKSDRSIFRS